MILKPVILRKNFIDLRRESNSYPYDQQYDAKTIERVKVQYIGGLRLVHTPEQVVPNILYASNTALPLAIHLYMVLETP